MADPRRRPPPPPPPPPPETESTDATTTEATRGTEMAMQTQQGGQNGETGADTQRATQSPAPPPPAQNAQSTPKAEASGGHESFKLKFCTVCASNNNRSMEAHLRLTTSPEQYPTISFGTGSLVRLPGPSVHQPNVYQFNSTSYKGMYDELTEKDKRLYSANGILNMLERNKGVKWGPERWQDWKVGVPRVGTRADVEGAEYSADKGWQGTESGVVDIVFTCEERCWDAVVDDLLTRGAPLNRPVHVFNVDIKDNHEEALVGGRAILELADALNAAAREEREAYVKSGGKGETFDQGGGRTGFDERVPDILAAWQDRWPQLPALWTLGWL